MAADPARPWFVTGGAGYIGAHVVERLLRAGQRAVVVDDLSTGDARRLPPSVPLLKTDLADVDAVRDLLDRERPVGVIHLAAKKSPTESVSDPLRYASENVGGLIALLSAMRGTGVRRMVFSSSCSVYGDADDGAVTESTPVRPISPYGESKVYGERLLAALADAGELRVIALRYFNVAGALDPTLRDRSDVSLVPNVLRAAAERRPVSVFGTDYPTVDGSCVRDYIDVRDLAEAHVLAAAAMDHGAAYRVYNTGTGAGVSVLALIDAARRVTGRSIEQVVLDRRPGDPPAIVAVVDRIHAELGWRARYSLDETIASAWNASPHEEGAR